MTIQIRRLFLAVPLVTIALCAYFVADAVTSLAASSLPQPRTRREWTLPTPPPPPARDVSEIRQRNIFCSTCDPEPAWEAAGGPGGDAALEEDADPVETTLDLTLVATLVGEGPAERSFAAIRAAERTLLYPEGAELAECEAVIEEIEERRVLLRNAGRSEFLAFEAAKGKGPARRPPKKKPNKRRRRRAMKLPPQIDKGIRALGGNRWEIQRGALNAMLSNTTLIARSARIVPVGKGGKVDGYRLKYVRPGSVYERIGMRSKDVIKAVNGQPITSPDQALKLYTRLRNASHLTISFARGGKTRTHEYIIR